MSDRAKEKMMSPQKSALCTLLGLIALLALAAELPPSSRTAEPPPPCGPEEIKVCVLAILATDQNDKVDKRVECIAKEVQKVDAKLTGFQVHKMLSKAIAVGGRGQFELIDDQTVGVTIDRGPDKDSRAQVKIEPPLLGEITYETCCGKFLPVITRYRTKDNQLLIIAVRVQLCEGK
jgi:hypothetical protein